MATRRNVGGGGEVEWQAVIGAVKEQGDRHAEGMERLLLSIRDGQRMTNESIDRLGATLTRQMETTQRQMAPAVESPPKESNNTLIFAAIGAFVGLAGILAAMINPIYSGQEQLSADTVRSAHVLGERVDLLRRDMSTEQAKSAALLRDMREIETQFDATWMAIDIELQHQDRWNAMLWNSSPALQHAPWIPRDYWPSMRRKEMGQ